MCQSLSHTNKKSQGNNGFTLIELLVVIAIIGLLSTLAVIALGSAREKARDSKRLSDLKQIQTALELHYTDNNAYPIQATTAGLGGGNFACLNIDGFGPSGCSSPYMGQVPVDPSNDQYTYQSEDGSTYNVGASLEGDIGGLSAGDVQASPSGIANR